VDALASRYNFAEMSGRRGITQLRWATFGAPSQVNAQSQVAFLYLAMRIGNRNTLDLATVPALMEQTLQLAAQQIPAIQDQLEKWNDLYCLGYGATYPIALEGALKLKEITYAHCEGMLSTEFKHGPLSAVSDDYPVIFAAGP